jgi:hypothetical protein
MIDVFEKSTSLIDSEHLLLEGICEYFQNENKEVITQFPLLG